MFKRHLEKFKELKWQKNAIDNDQTTLNQVYEIRFEIADLKHDNKELKRMLKQLIRKKLNTTDGI